MNGTKFDRERLYDYTKFHIGVYSTLVAGILLFIGNENWGDGYEPFIIPALFFAMAGACEGAYLHDLYVSNRRHTVFRR